MTQLGFNFFQRTERLLSRHEMEEALEKESSFFRDYAETYWLERYFLMKALSRTIQMPSITSTITDTPTGVTNEFRSKTENSALQTIDAESWIKHLHDKLELLPNDLKQLIKKKYLENRSGDGKSIADEYVYPELHIGRAKYYGMKKQGLEELGRLLYGTYEFE